MLIFFSVLVLPRVLIAATVRAAKHEAMSGEFSRPPLVIPYASAAKGGALRWRKSTAVVPYKKVKNAEQYRRRMQPISSSRAFDSENASASSASAILSGLAPRIAEDVNVVSAAAAASLQPLVEPPSKRRSCRGMQGDRAVDAMAQRLAMGRTDHLLARLVGTRLLTNDLSDVAVAEVGPQAGLFGTVDGGDVFIVDAMTRRGVAYADVAYLEHPPRDAKDVNSNVRVLGLVRTVKAETVKNIGLHFDITISDRKRVRCTPRTGSFADEAARYAAFNSARHASWTYVREGTSVASTRHNFKPGQVHHVMPREALLHQAATGHSLIQPRDDFSPDAHYILDLPLPIAIDIRPYRCRTCQSRNETDIACRRNLPLRRFAFDVTDADVCDVAPGVLCYSREKRGTLYFTDKFLLTLVQMFVSRMNVREVRRTIVDMYSSNMLSLDFSVLHGDLGAFSLVNPLRSVPDNALLGSMLKHALAHLAGPVVRVMRRRQFVYNGAGLRGDGNWQLAKRVMKVTGTKHVKVVRRPDVMSPMSVPVPQPKRSVRATLKNRIWHVARRGLRQRRRRFRVSRPHTVVLAWCGVDGSLLVPMSLCRAEAWADIEASLEPLLRDLRDARLDAGMSMEE